MAVDPTGNVYMAFALRWAYYTDIIKFRRTGATTWVRDGADVLIPGTGARHLRAE